MTPSLPEPNDRRSEIEAELAELDALYRSKRYRGWKIRVGPLAIHRHYHSMYFTWVFVLFNSMLWVIGAVLILIGGDAANLGIAVVVGATFSFGTFLTEVWSKSVDSEHEIHSEMAQDELEELRWQRRELLQELQSIEDEMERHQEEPPSV